MKKDTLKRALKPFFFNYFITDPVEFGNTATKLQTSLQNSFSKHHIDFVCFRDKVSKDIETLAKITLDISKKHNKKALINGNIELAVKLGFDGVHLTSTQFDKIELAKQHNLFTVISCHSEEEVKTAKEKLCDAVTYSPIFYKENKGEPKGIENLEKIVQKYQDDSFKIIALGGIITNEHIEKIKQTKAKAFASIRYFK